MYCSKCGRPNIDNAHFCSNCGTKLADVSVGSARGAAPGATKRNVSPPSPTSPRQSSEPQFDEDAWRAAIGAHNIEYYLPRMLARHTENRGARWHWPAFFVTWYWLLYRKLWGWAAVYFFVPALVIAAMGVVISALDAPLKGAIWLVYLVVVFVAPAMWANSLYYRHCNALIERSRKASRTREQFLAQLHARGGTSSAAAVVVAIIAVVMAIGILAAIAIPQYNQYTKQAKSAEAILAGMKVAQLVGAHFERTGEIPPSIDPFQAQVGSSRYVTGMRLSPDDGVIEVDIFFGPTIVGGTVRLVPGVDTNGKVVWTCKAPAEMIPMVPVACRG